MNVQNVQHLRVIHVNIRGLRANLQNLQHFLVQEDFPDVVTINETKLGVSTDINSSSFPNYFIAARREPTLNGGRHGSMILVSDSITEVNEIENLRQFENEVIGVRLKTKNDIIFNIITYYNAPGNYVNERIFDDCSRLRGKTIIAGDLNCKNVSWGSTRTDSLGEHLLNVLIENRFHVLNNGEKTRYNPVNGNEQALDVIACNSKAIKYFSSFGVGDDVGSDHYPLITEFALGNDQNEPKCFRNIQETDWGKFKNELSTLCLDTPKNKREIDVFLSISLDVSLSLFSPLSLS